MIDIFFVTNVTTLQQIWDRSNKLFYRIIHIFTIFSFTTIKMIVLIIVLSYKTSFKFNVQFSKNQYFNFKHFYKNKNKKIRKKWLSFIFIYKYLCLIF